MSEKPRAVPKFASFRPKQPPNEDDSAKPKTRGDRSSVKEVVDKDQARDHDRDRDRTHERHRERERDRSHRHRHHSHRHRYRSPQHSRQQRPKSPQRPPAATPALPKRTDKGTEDIAIFVEDRKGDPQIKAYGANRYGVPRYYRVGAGSVLGLPRHLKIDRDQGEEKGLVISPIQRHAAKREKYVFSRNERKQERLLRVKMDVSKDDDLAKQLDFLQFPSLRKNRISKAEGSTSSEDEGHYRSILGKAKFGMKPEDTQMEYISDSESAQSESGRAVSYNDALKQKTIELSRAVKDRPQDIEAWLSLIHHQDSLLGLDGGKRATTAEKRSVADIKLSIYEKALRNMSNSRHNREALLVGMMEEGSKIWNIKEQARRWDKVSRDNLDSHILWRKYLDFQQTNFTEFRYEAIRDSFLGRIKLLLETAKHKTYNESVLLYEHVIYTVLRTTLLMREAGYREAALAAWQAVLEINFFGSRAEQQSPAARIESFKEFWDSEVPRIGELGARGWDRFVENPLSTDAPPAQSDREIPSVEATLRNVFETWAHAETQASEMTNPARTRDDVNPDDTFRVVLGSDIEDFLIFLPLKELPHLQKTLINAFLIFSQLPPLSLEDDATYTWWTDGFLRGEFLDCDNQHLLAFTKSGNTSRSDSTDPVQESRTISIEWLWQMGWNYSLSVDTLFPQRPWFHCFVNRKHIYGNVEPVSVEYIRNCLSDLVKVTKNSLLAEYYLGFEFFNSPDTIKKTAKSLLKMFSNSINLYNAYAAIEWAKGNHQIAEKVVMSALGMPIHDSGMRRSSPALLWRTWIWACLQQDQRGDALRVLLSMVDNDYNGVSQVDITSPTLRLKARRHFVMRREQHLSGDDWEIAVTYGELSALLEYLTPESDDEPLAGRNIESALNTYDIFSASLAARNLDKSIHRENLHQLAAHLLYYHAGTGPFRPALIRAYVIRSIELFPQNTLFLSMLSWTEARVRIDDRVRSILKSTVLTAANDSYVGRVFAIKHELEIGNAHSARAAFENALESPACASNAGLWRLYIHFCLKSREYRANARDVFYRGVRACPWSKKLLLTAFDELSGDFGFTEMRDAYLVMSEKELRIHVELDEKLREVDLQRRDKGRML